MIKKNYFERYSFPSKPMKHFISLALCIGFFSFSRAQAPLENLGDAIRVIDTWLQAERDYGHLPGISVGITRDQKMIWDKGYGQADVKKNVPADPSTIYSICSISKLFTSVAIMKLYDAGKLRLDDSVGAILPGFSLQQQFKDSGPITIRSLLTHSSGLPRESEYPYWTGPDFSFPTKQQVNDKLGQQQTLYPASTYFQYSNLGLTLLGEIVEKVSGVPYDTYVEENILKPLRLADTHPYLPVASWGGKFATGYGAIKRDGTRDPVALFDAKGITPAAGFSSTVEDLGRFASWQFRLLNSGHAEVLKPSTLREMQRVQWVDPDWKTNWGLGFSVFQQDGKKLVGHGGSCPGYRTSLILDPLEKYAFVVMINAGGTTPDQYALEMRNILLKVPKEKTRTDSLQLDQYAGHYNAQPWGSETVILPWFGKLALLSLPTASPKDMVLFKHVKGDTFRRIRSDETLGEELTFEKDKAGLVSRYWRYSNYYTRSK
jgi:CubicO group peptidase (beta-lactamase class C family)